MKIKRVVDINGKYGSYILDGICSSNHWVMILHNIYGHNKKEVKNKTDGIKRGTNGLARKIHKDESDYRDLTIVPVTNRRIKNDFFNSDTIIGNNNYTKFRGII